MRRRASNDPLNLASQGAARSPPPRDATTVIATTTSRHIILLLGLASLLLLSALFLRSKSLTHSSAPDTASDRDYLRARDSQAPGSVGSRHHDPNVLAASSLETRHHQHHQQAANARLRADHGHGSAPAIEAGQAAAQGVQMADMLPMRVVVVGGGLAGLTSALEACATLERLAPGGGGDRWEVVVVEKMPKLGGNSMKASSGINGLNPDAGDSEALFEGDVVKSGGGLSKQELVATLVHNSPDALAFLAAQGVNLGGVTRLGGHSVPRSRTVVGGANVGYAIMSVLIAKARATQGVRVLEGHRLVRIERGGDGRIAGVALRREQPDAAAAAAAAAAAGAAPEAGADLLPCSAVILATGGFAANQKLLQKVAPEAASLATTNGPWAQGDGLDLAREVGAALWHLEQVQVHPTGFVDPQDPEAGTKFLAPEKLRGVGGLLLDGQGRRFVDELATRDRVSAAMMALPDRSAWLLMGPAAAAEYGAGAVDFYCKKGLMKQASSVAEAAALLGAGASEATLQATLQANAAAAAASPPKPDAFGKTVFPHPPDPAAPGTLYVARVTPVVHYTMGGVEVNERAEVLLEKEEQGQGAGGGGGSRPRSVLSGLYAAGEASGGLHGANRLGGNSLLECVVFGRLAGRNAAEYASNLAAAQAKQQQEALVVASL